MKHIKTFTFAIFAALSLSGMAQDCNKIADYFKQTLQGHLPQETFDKRVSIKKINEAQSLVWKAWKQANNQLQEPHLLPIDSIGKLKGAWQLPDSLEPHATMPFYYGCKGEKPQSGYPFFLYLHGSGPKQHEWQTGLALAQRFKDAPSVYFIPQIPHEGEWYRWWQKSKQFAWQRLLRQLMLNDSIDANKLYVFGISEGGYGSQRLASFYADYWAAAGPMAGGEPLKNAPAENLENIGFSFRTGADDNGFYRNKLTQYTKDALDSLETLNPSGFRHKVELIPNRQHFIDYSSTTPWLLLFKRNATPKHFIWEDFDMDGLHRTGFYNLRIDKRPCDSLRTRYEVNINDNNRIDIVIENVHYTTIERDPMYGIELKFKRTYTPSSNGEITLFLNNELVDLSRPVYITINGKRAFNSVSKPNLKSMIHAVSTFYDRERIFASEVKLKY